MPELNLQVMEKKWQVYWEKEGIHRFDRESKKPVFSVDTPPPTVSGKMHLGHALGYSQADVMARYKRMQGFELFYPFGFDDNGLATERFVEKETNKRAVDMTRAEFVQLCLDTTKKAEAELEQDFKSIGIACDWNLVYRTIEPKVVKIAQESFLDFYKQKRVYRIETPHMYCTQCRTAIAQAELEDRELESKFNDIWFELEESNEKKLSEVKEKILISTTRPELLCACVAIFVHPEDKRHKGLVGKTAIVPLFGQRVKILADTRVNIEKGSGIVMCCTFGDQTDMEWQKAYKLPIKIALQLDGKLNELGGSFKGLKVKEAREKIIQELQARGLLKEQRKIMHAVNVHERCKNEIEFLVSWQWFIKYLDLKKEFMNTADQVQWNPMHMKKRLENWINGLQWDWCISRQRYFGVPFPLWYCKKCGMEKIAESKQLPIDPLVDKPNGKCEKCNGNEFEPEKDVLDTWFTSSLTPQINTEWTVNEKKFKQLFPMSLRPQGHDIVNLWAFNTIVKSWFHHKKAPWKTMMVNGFALDPKGQKMSKSIGNVIPPQEVIAKYSGDCLRYWTCSVTLGEDVPYKEKEVIAAQRLTIKLVNAGKLVEKLAEGLNYESVKLEKLKLEPEDEWVLARVHALVEESTKLFEQYQFARVLSNVREFFWLEYCDHYLEQIKTRIYSGENKESKIAAQYIAVKVFDKVVRLLAPFMPHITEEIFQSMKLTGFKKQKSIHWSEWPTPNSKYMNAIAMENGARVNEVIAGVRKYKSEHGLPMNAELSEVHVYVDMKEWIGGLEKGKTTIQRTVKAKKVSVHLGKASTRENARAINEHIEIEIISEQTKA